MIAMFDGKPIFGPRGPAGPDGNPIGTVISYMGLTAPEDYLVCDGAIYDISAYPELARFFEKQFGTKNHFGGNGESTFAVPDLRNLFLRGYHGEAEEKLSGEIGEKQDATIMPYVYAIDSNGTFGVGCSSNAGVYFPDSAGRSTKINYVDGRVLESDRKPADITMRPVNAAVLYCIKAVTSVPMGNTYSREETRVGTWIDGKPLYRKVINATLGGNGVVVDVFVIEDLSTVVDIHATCVNTSNDVSMLISGFDVYFRMSTKTIKAVSNGSWTVGCPVTITIEYTKTTD